MVDIQQDTLTKAAECVKEEDSEQVDIKIASTKRRYPYGAVFFLLSSTVGQSYSGTGLQAVLEIYFSRFLFVCLSQADQLSTAAVNIYIALYQICALSAGFLADRVLGNFLTQVVSTVLTAVGVCLLTFATWQYTVSPPPCCADHSEPSLDLGAFNWSSNCSELNKVSILDQIDLHISPSVNMGLSILGLILFSVGYGHINTVQSVLVADQFSADQAKAKERSFSWFYWCCNIGALVGESGMPVLRQSVGFIVAWTTVLGATSFSAILFLSGGCLYIKKKPERLCSSKPATSADTQPLLGSEQRTTAQYVRTRLAELLPFVGVFTPLIIFWAIFYQQSSTWILQGTMMDCQLGALHVPPAFLTPDLMPSVNDFLVLLIIPALDYLLYPHLERTMAFKIRPLHKMIAGMVCAGLSFLLSGLLQLYLVELPQGQDCQGAVSIAWQLPQILLISFAEVLVSVTGLEFAYSQAPPDFRNTITSLWYISQALGTLLNAGVAQIPGLTLLGEFFLYTGLMGVVTLLFLGINWRYTYKHSS